MLVKEKFIRINYNAGIYYYNIQSKLFKNLKILHLSDTHFSSYRFIKKQNGRIYQYLFEEEFDLIFHTGDIINISSSSFSLKERDYLKRLKAKYGKFYVNGNHEHDFNEERNIEKIMRELGFENLSDKTKKIKLNNIEIEIVGVDLLKPQQIKSLIRKNCLERRILITHNLNNLTPTEIKIFDLVLSGHLHAGEINLGIFNGTYYLKNREGFVNNYGKYVVGFKEFKSEKGRKTISFIHPGMFSYIRKQFKIPRLFTKKEGPVILSFK